MLNANKAIACLAALIGSASAASATASWEFVREFCNQGRTACLVDTVAPRPLWGELGITVWAMVDGKTKAPRYRMSGDFGHSNIYISADGEDVLQIKAFVWSFVDVNEPVIRAYHHGALVRAHSLAELTPGFLALTAVGDAAYWVESATDLPSRGLVIVVTLAGERFAVDRKTGDLTAEGRAEWSEAGMVLACGKLVPDGADAAQLRVSCTSHGEARPGDTMRLVYLPFREDDFCAGEAADQVVLYMRGHAIKRPTPLVRCWCVQQSLGSR